MAGPGICVLCLADTCTSEVHTVFNPVAPYGYLLSDMYLFMADITNRAPNVGGGKVRHNLHSSLSPL